MQSDKARSRAGTRAGVSESVVEMAAESFDPAMWAAMQLTKPGQPPAQTVGEVRDRIAAIISQALDMAYTERWKWMMKRMNTLAVMYENMHQTANDPKAKRERRIQAQTMREAMGVVREGARR